MRKYGICLLLGLCLLLTACGAGQETPDGDAVPAAYWTGGDADLPRLRAETIHCSEAGFYLEDGGADRSPLVTETFSGTLPDGEQELTVDFLWCVFLRKVISWSVIKQISQKHQSLRLLLVICFQHFPAVICRTMYIGRKHIFHKLFSL